MNTVSLDERGRVSSVSLSGSPSDGKMHRDDIHEIALTLEDVVPVGEPLKSSTIMSPVAAKKGKEATSRNSVLYFLQSVPYLFTLSTEQIEKLEVMVREYNAMDVIIEEGVIPQHIYILASGSVEVMNTKRGLKRVFGHRRVGNITAPGVFGLDDAIIESPSVFNYHASTDATLLLIQKQRFIELFPQSPILANAVSSRILQTLPAFSVFQDFCRAIFGISASAFEAQGGFQNDAYKLSIRTIVDIYLSSGTVFHKAACSNHLDMEALRYCVRRLPTNFIHYHNIVLSHFLPVHIANELNAEHQFSKRNQGASPIAVDTGKRRRCAWRLGDSGKIVVIMRDGFTDTIDIVTNICMFSVETQKLHNRMKRLVSPSAGELLRGTAWGSSIDDILDRLGFSRSDANSLKEIWGDDVLSMLHGILLHRDDFVVQIDTSDTRMFSQDPYVSWAQILLKNIRARLEIGETDSLPSNVMIDVIFSSNRTLKNLFCSMSGDFGSFLEKYNETDPESGYGNDWKNKEDRYYYILTRLLTEEDSLREAYHNRLHANGFTLMEDDQFSSLIMDLIDVRQINIDDVDSALKAHASKAKQRSLESNPHFIINIDKTFGGQIESILRSVLLTLGRNIRSVNMTGKAAGLAGNRGDVVIPSRLLFSKQSFGEDSTDEIRICNKDSIVEEDIIAHLKASCSSNVHRGSCITIPGSIMQSESVLKFYKIVHGCTALDMQSSYVARQLEESKRSGIFNQRIASRYLFYLDDMPLGNSDGTELKPQKREILSTLYATERALLQCLLSS